MWHRSQAAAVGPVVQTVESGPVVVRIDKMNGLRVYINPHVKETCGGFGVFYSRRENGPYYRWAFEETVSLWRVSRVSPSDFAPKALANANWKGVPAALQKSMVEHYQE
jgi:hypothetical protein